MENLLYLESLIYGCYFLVLFSVYCIVGFSIYLNRETEIKLLKVSLDPKRAFKNRKAINESIANAEAEKKMALLWPVFLIKKLQKNVKKKIEKESK